MTAYAIFIMEKLKDPAAMEAYREAVGPTLEGHEMTFRARGDKVEAMEGPAPIGTVILEFPDVQAAHAWYESAAYQEASKLRRQGGDYRVLIVDGLG